MGYMIDTVPFNLPVFTHIVPEYKQLNKYLKQCIKDYRKSFPQSNTSNVQAWHSGYQTHANTNAFDPLIDIALDKCYCISRDSFNAPIVKPYYFVLNNMWIAMYQKNDWTKLHAHFPSVFSLCYYVDVKDDCSPITFIGENDEINIQPKNGMLLIWNGMIPHKVAPTKKKRTCICMNIMVSK